MHPSQTNYIPSIAGALCNVTNDGRPDLIAERTIAAPAPPLRDGLTG
jgi:hypothetical protein